MGCAVAGYPCRSTDALARVSGGFLMLTTVSRPYTDAEFDQYNDRMATSPALVIAVVVLLGAVIGGIVTLVAYAVHWMFVWLTSGSVTWTVSLIVGASAAALTMVVCWLGCRGEDWTERPPGLATDVTATAYAAWRMEGDGLDVVFVFRVEADRYLVISEYALTLLLEEEGASEWRADSIPSGIRLVLLGEDEFCIAMDVSLTGPAIPLTRVVATSEETDPDWLDETPIPDGLFMTNELPARIRRAIHVA